MMRCPDTRQRKVPRCQQQPHGRAHRNRKWLLSGIFQVFYADLYSLYSKLLNMCYF